MKAFILLMVTILMLATAAPVAAQTGDPPCFACTAPLGAGEDRVHVPPTGLDNPLPPVTPSRHACWRMVEAQRLMHSAADAIADADSLPFRLDMEMTMTSSNGASWTSHAILIGMYLGPDHLEGSLSVTNPWSEFRSQVIVADGMAFVSDPLTGDWREGLQWPSTYYPINLAGRLLHIKEADMDGLVLSGWRMLEGEPVYRLTGRDASGDELKIEYFLGATDGLLRRVEARSDERPGWGDEEQIVRIAAVLTARD
jgi:hypothetical protein